jgi:hypothetical protein
MSTYNAIAWLPLCAGLTGIGLIASWFAMRRRGLASGLRGAAWSLLPLAAYLTGSIQMFWKIGTAIGQFATSLVLSPKVWSGVAVAGLAAVLFVASGPGRRRRRRARRSGPDDGTAPGRDLQPADAGATGTADSGRRAVENKRPTAGAPADDDMREIEEILRRRGIS